MNLTVPALYLLCGSQGKGKSHLIKYIMHELQNKFELGIIFTNTFFDDNPFPFIKKKYIYPHYDETALINLMNIQKKCIENGIRNEAFCIFDDCLEKEQFRSQALLDLCTQLRHYHITVIFSTQYCNALPPRIRTNAMSVFIFDSDTRVNLESIYDSYAQRFDSYTLFKNYVFDNLKEKYNFIYYDKTKERERDEKMEDIYEIMRCPRDIPDFKIKFIKRIDLQNKDKY